MVYHKRLQFYQIVLGTYTGGGFEIGNKTVDDYGLSLGDANTYFNNSSQTLERGQEPKLGGIMCYGYTPNGHVCIVEEIIDADTIRCSESDYGTTYFITRIRKRNWGVGGWDWIENGNGQYQGCIYHPGIDPTPPEPPQPVEFSNFKWWMARLMIMKRKGLL